jgi:Uma2 family endonuclease
MSVSIPKRPPAIIYPESDDQPMAENTLQFEWIVTIKEGLDRAFHHRDDIFVAGDLFWYPVEGRPDIHVAPDALVAIRRPKGHRGRLAEERDRAAHERDQATQQLERVARERDADRQRIEPLTARLRSLGIDLSA